MQNCTALELEGQPPSQVSQLLQQVECCVLTLTLYCHYIFKSFCLTFTLCEFANNTIDTFVHSKINVIECYRTVDLPVTLILSTVAAEISHILI